MTNSAGELVFEIGADFSGFTRAVDSAGQKLDQLSKQASNWSGARSAAVSQRLSTAIGQPLALTGSMNQAARALRSGPASSAGDDADQGSKVIGHLSDQLALLRTTGAAHDAIAERMKIETEQAKLGTDATDAQRQAVASLVTQIDAAKSAQAALRTEQAGINEAWGYGADLMERSLSGIILSGAKAQDVAKSVLTSVARQGLSAALTGSGSLAGLLGTEGSRSQTGGLFGALQSLFSGGLGGSAASGFSGLYANGGSIDAGKWGIVGEKGAEVVSGPATVVPWNRIAAQGAAGQATTHQTINFNVSSPDAPSFARSESQMAALLSRAVGRGQRNQ